MCYVNLPPVIPDSERHGNSESLFSLICTVNDTEGILL